jgi:hypothetical protein
MKVFSISRAGVERRWLMPAYRFGNSLMAWECALCGKLFSISVEEAQSAAQLPPPYIEREFRLHSCELQLCDRLTDVEIYRVEEWPEEGRYGIRTTAYGRIQR